MSSEMVKLGECWNRKCKHNRDGNCTLEICSTIKSYLEEMMAHIDNPCISVVEDVCALLGHPKKDEKGCYCRCRIEEG